MWCIPRPFSMVIDKPLDSTNRYVLHFDKGQTPPTNATWSVSIYDPHGFYVPNSINRYRSCRLDATSIQPRRFARSLHSIEFARDGQRNANWLPAPASGPFNLTVRNYWPTEAVLDGTYNLPPVKKVQ